MKIITIDSQKLILHSLKKRLIETGYDVEAASSVDEGIELLKKETPDLVTVDIKMPEMNGIDVLKYIKEAKLNTKVVVISGEVEEDLITDLFDYGVDEFIRKPVSLNEIVARISRLIGSVNTLEQNLAINFGVILRNKSVGIVIPCYNEADRFFKEEFRTFINNNIGYYLCFINDGSTDNTLEKLKEIQQGNENCIGIVDCAENGGKAEAVRQGMLYLTEKSGLDFDYLGFLDADLSTNFKDFNSLIDVIERSSYKIVSGSRIERVGANIKKASKRRMISLTINYIIQRILKMNFRDTQCGAKIIDKDVVPLLFKDKFITRWLFDVEMFLRMKKHFGDKVKSLICEQPLRRWIHADGSKLSMKDSVKIALQLTKIATHYR